MQRIRVRTRSRCQMLEVTQQVQEVVRASGVREGAVLVQSLHTTAGVTVNENADPDVLSDLLAKLESLVPHREAYYRHAEGNSDSHLKTSLVGPSVTLVVSEGRVLLGQWQGIYLCEFDGPRTRELAVQLLAGG
jgi:secondary thiamine-phosphate synthase enzyme